MPDEIALVGFDNWEIIATACRPPLTTVDMNLRELGHAAAARLLAAIEGQFTPGVEKLPCSLVIRESSRARAMGQAAAPTAVPSTAPGTPDG